VSLRFNGAKARGCGGGLYPTLKGGVTKETQYQKINLKSHSNPTLQGGVRPKNNIGVLTPYM